VRAGRLLSARRSLHATWRQSSHLTAAFPSCWQRFRDCLMASVGGSRSEPHNSSVAGCNGEVAPLPGSSRSGFRRLSQKGEGVFRHNEQRRPPLIIAVSAPWSSASLHLPAILKLRCCAVAGWRLYDRILLWVSSSAAFLHTEAAAPKNSRNRV